MIWQAETQQKVMQFSRLAINLPRFYFRSFDREQVDPNLRVTNGLQPSHGCKLPTCESVLSGERDLMSDHHFRLLRSPGNSAAAYLHSKLLLVLL